MGYTHTHTHNGILFVLSHFSHVQLFSTPWTIASWSPLSMGFSRQEYQSGLPSPGDLSNLRIKPSSLMSPASAGGFFTTSTTWEALQWNIMPFATRPARICHHHYGWCSSFFASSTSLHVLFCFLSFQFFLKYFSILDFYKLYFHSFYIAIFFIFLYKPAFVCLDPPSSLKHFFLHTRLSNYKLFIHSFNNSQ